ncbi:MAG TPA: sigma-70 family RNA polymerase sigma factor [bacterium]
MTEFSRQLEAELPRLRRYARALVHDAQRAEDLVQDCMERALRKSHLWREGTSLSAWLFTMLHNLHASAARRFFHLPRHVPFDETDTMPHVAPTQTDSVNLAGLQAALDKLPDEQRQVLLLVGMEQRRYEEVAAILNIPLGTVMSRLFRARERLRGLLADDSRPPLRRVK